jgi:hypothetical protein
VGKAGGVLDGGKGDRLFQSTTLAIVEDRELAGMPAFGLVTGMEVGSIKGLDRSSVIFSEFDFCFINSVKQKIVEASGTLTSTLVSWDISLEISSKTGSMGSMYPNSISSTFANMYPHNLDVVWLMIHEPESPSTKGNIC